MKIKKSLQEKGALQSVYAEDYERFKVMKEWSSFSCFRLEILVSTIRIMVSTLRIISRLPKTLI